MDASGARFCNKFWDKGNKNKKEMLSTFNKSFTKVYCIFKLSKLMAQFDKKNSMF